MVNDPIIAEVRKIRQDTLQKFNYDLDAILPRFEDERGAQQNAK